MSKEAQSYVKGATAAVITGGIAFLAVKSLSNNRRGAAPDPRYISHPRRSFTLPMPAIFSVRPAGIGMIAL